MDPKTDEKKKKRREREISKTRKKGATGTREKEKSFYVADKENASEVGIRKAYKLGDSVNW